MNRVIDFLAKPIEAWDWWYDRYDRGYEAGMDAVCEGAVTIVLDMLKARNEIIVERCNHIEAVISEMELYNPELHTDVESIDKSIRVILDSIGIGKNAAETEEK